MTPKFKVGEIAILGFMYLPFPVSRSAFRYEGQECTVLAIGATIATRGLNKRFQSYDVQFKDGIRASVVEPALHKRPPDQKYPGQFTPATKPMDQIITDCNKKAASIPELLDRFGW